MRHAKTVTEDLPVERFVSQCSCGWQSDPHATRLAANYAFLAHEGRAEKAAALRSKENAR